MSTVEPPPPLPDLGYEMDGFRFGRGTNMGVRSIDFGELSVEAGDVPRPRADGVRFGRDYYRGRLVTIEGDIVTKRDFPDDIRAAANLLEEAQSAWTPEVLRMSPGRVTSLRMVRGGVSRRLFGRPNSFSASTGRTLKGWIPYVATFRCADHLFYDDTEYTDVISMVPESIGGLEGPLVGDLFAADDGEGLGKVIIGGTKPSWLVFRINGPIVNPVIEVVDQWYVKMNISLLDDQFLVVDPTPWNRFARRDNGANASGIFTADSARLSQMRLPVGENAVLLRGQDETRTATAQVWWRDTYSSF